MATFAQPSSSKALKPDGSRTGLGRSCPSTRQGWRTPASTCPHPGSDTRIGIGGRSTIGSEPEGLVGMTGQARRKVAHSHQDPRERHVSERQPLQGRPHGLGWSRDVTLVTLAVVVVGQELVEGGDHACSMSWSDGERASRVTMAVTIPRARHSGE